MFFFKTQATADYEKVFFDFKIHSISGEVIDFNKYKNNVILLVNTASYCGFTPQYKGLQKLYEDYGQTMEILAFPCNDFGNQEKGDSEEIEAFCQNNYGVTFMLMEKVSIKGSNIHPVYNWLLNKSENGVSNHNVRWNFHKFIVDENGSLVGSFKSGVDPTDNQIISFASEK